MQVKNKFEDIPFFVFTCDRYVHLIPYLADCFNRHWGDWKEVNVLGFTEPKSKLPDNFNFISLGNQNQYGRDWGGPIKEYFKNLDAEYFGMFWDDLFPIANINFDLLEKGIDYLKERKCDRLYFQTHNKCQGKKFDKDFKIIDQSGEYRYSVQPSIWRLDEFLAGLCKGQSCWSFEVNNSTKAKKNGKTYIYPLTEIMPEYNVYLKGKFREKVLDKYTNGWYKQGNWTQLQGKDLDNILEIREKYFYV